MKAQLRSRHSDVLDANPSDGAGKTKLVDELKRRGNAAYKARSMDEALMLYGAAIGHAPTNHILYGNRSMAYLMMSKAAEALKDADRAVELDPSWKKGWFRRAGALSKLGRHEESADAYDQAGMPPKASAERALAVAAAEAAAAAPSEATAAPPAPPVTHAPTIAISASASGAAAKKKKTKASGGAMKGYKTTADGRTTSFFHNDLDETAKGLLKGDYKSHIAPQAVAASSLPDSAVVNKSGVGSSWNDGTTWESKDIEAWTHERLRAVLHPSSVRGDGVELETTEVDDVEGEANIIILRGKKKFVFNLQVRRSFLVCFFPFLLFAHIVLCAHYSSFAHLAVHSVLARDGGRRRGEREAAALRLQPRRGGVGVRGAVPPRSRHAGRGLRRGTRARAPVRAGRLSRAGP
jgi:hypothetical protein